MLFKTSTAVLAAVFFMISFLSPASGIASNFGAESSTGAVNIAGEYSLAQGGFLTDQASLGMGLASRQLQASGLGPSCVTDSISGRDSSGQSFSISKTASVDGELLTSSSAVATPEGGVLSQGTDLSGDGGLFAIRSASPGNTVAAAAVFSDDGYLSSTISGAAEDHAALGGDAQVMGVNCFDERAAGVFSSGAMGMSVSGLYFSGEELQKFGLAAINEKRSGLPTRTNYGSIPPGTTVYGYYNDPQAYVLQGYRWDPNPVLKLYLRQDSALSAEGLTSGQAANAIAGAANKWDDVARENIFADSGLVTASGLYIADRYDGRNVHAWKRITRDALAYSRTYYTQNSLYKVNGYFRALESDVVYNSRWGWTTNSGNAILVRDSQGNAIPEYSILDLQTVATHELGHTMGLGDTYLHSTYKYDLAQIMGFYDAPQPDLGAGDIAGIKKLYG